jgi:hypothetical protein
MEFNPFDAGVEIDLDFIGVKSRVRAVMCDRRISTEELTKRTGVGEDQLVTAFNQIEVGHPEGARVISVVAGGLGVCPNWLLTGMGQCPLTAVGQLIRIAWEYLYRRNVLHEVGKKFVKWLQTRFAQNELGVGNALYRQGVPQSTEDVARLYEKWKDLGQN